MNLEEFNKAGNTLLDRIKDQNPVAIIQFGSSIQPEEFIPGVSDLDLLVVSGHPIEDTVNDVGFEYFPNTPQSFFNELVHGNPFIMDAFLNGKVLYDPQNFMEKVQKTLDANNLVLSPTDFTTDYHLQSVGNQLSSAINRYYAFDVGANRLEYQKMRRNLYAAVRSMAMITYEKITGFFPKDTDTIRKVVTQSDASLISLLDTTRKNITSNNEDETQPSEQKVLVPEYITDVEESYLHRYEHMGVPTNMLIAHFQETKPAFFQMLSGRYNNIDLKQLYVGKNTEGTAIFGIDINAGTDFFGYFRNETDINRYIQASQIFR